jgi:hypothetical protein
MESFTYSFSNKVLYRYGNIPVTMLLLIYLLTSVTNLNHSLIYLIPFLISAILIYFLNRHYLNLYKLLPYKIEADNEKIKCSKFLLSKKEITIFYSDIKSLKGGIFEGKVTGLMNVCDGKNNICIGFFNSLKNVKGLQTIILSKVNRSVYDEVVNKLQIKKSKMNAQSKNESVKPEKSKNKKKKNP